MIDLLEDVSMGNIFDADTGLTKNGFVDFAGTYDEYLASQI